MLTDEGRIAAARDHARTMAAAMFSGQILAQNCLDESALEAAERVIAGAAALFTSLVAGIAAATGESPRAVLLSIGFDLRLAERIDTAGLAALIPPGEVPMPGPLLRLFGAASEGGISASLSTHWPAP